MDRNQVEELLEEEHQAEDQLIFSIWKITKIMEQ